MNVDQFDHAPFIERLRRELDRTLRLAEAIRATINIYEAVRLDSAADDDSPAPSAQAASAPKPPVSASAPRVVHWTPERLAVLRGRYPIGDPSFAILAEVNALPGPEIQLDRIAIKAGSMGLKRPQTNVVPPVEPEEKPYTGMVSPETKEAWRANAARASEAARLKREQEKAEYLREPKLDPDEPMTKDAPEASVRLPPSPPERLTKAEAMARVSSGIAAKLGNASEPSPSPAPRTAPKEADDGPVLADLEQVRTWAAARGLPFVSWNDLKRVNDRRERLGLPPFVRKFQQKGIRG
jgi:hypothetical protein